MKTKISMTESVWDKIQSEIRTIMNEDPDVFLRLYARFYGELLK